MQPPNVIWITLDSVRYDRTSLSSLGRDTTPNLQRIASLPQGASFSLCIGHSEWTRGAVGSILTGTPPSSHRLGMKQNQILADEIRTVPELLTEEGFFTACLSENPIVGPSHALDRGFQRYQGTKRLVDYVKEYPLIIFKHLLKTSRNAAGLTRDARKHSSAYRTAKIANDWLTEFSGTEEPFFFYLHFNEPHRPYYPPSTYLRQYSENVDRALTTALDIHEHLYETIANGCKLSDKEWRDLWATYDAEIRYTDECIGGLFDHIRSLDLGDTIVVITADHGELFGEHGLLAHKVVLDDALVHLPLVVYGLESIHHQTDQLVQHIDLVQTLLSLTGAHNEQLRGVDLRDQRRELAYSQRGARSYERDIQEFKQYNPKFDDSRFHDSLLTAARTKEYKLLSSEDRTDLFELPDESTNVSDEHPELLSELTSSVSEWLDREAQPIGEPKQNELSESMKARLSDLGYLTK